MSRRTDTLAPERQQRLFEAAAREFAAHGFDGASLNRILATAGMGKSSFYHYFDDKADLCATLVERALEALFAEIGTPDLGALTAAGFWDSFETCYHACLGGISRDPELVQLGGLFYRLRADPRTGAPTDRLAEATRGWIDAVIARGQALGVLRRDLPRTLLVETALALAETLDRWVIAHWDGLSEAARAELPALHVGLFRDLLGARPG